MGNDIRQRELPGNHPLVLDDPERIWQVRAGWVDVFAVLPRPGDRRVHLYRAVVGDHLFGVGGKNSARIHLVAVGTPETQVVWIDRAEFQEGLTASTLPGQVAPVVDHWIRGLTHGAAHGLSPPGQVIPLPVGVVCQRPPGAVVTPARGTLWISARGALCFLGQQQLSLGERVELFPVAVPGWLLAQESAVQVTGEPTEKVLADPRWWAGLDRFHQAILNYVILSEAYAADAQRERLVYRDARDQTMVRNSLSALAAVTETEEDIPARRAEETALLAACRMVGNELGISVRRPLDTLEQVKGNMTNSVTRGWSLIQSSGMRGDQSDRSAESVEAIARASRFHARPVELDGDWWRRDNGPLLAFRKVDRRPIALLPKSAARYEQVDTTTGKKRRVAKADADALDSVAYQFHRPFPYRVLTPWQLFQFGLHGTHRDWLMVIAFGLAGALLALFTPIATGWLFDRIIPGAERNNLLLVVLALTVAAFADVLFRLSRNIALLRAETRMDADIGAGLWGRLLDLPPRFFRRFTVGDLESRAAGLGSLRWLLVDVALTTILNGVFALVYIALLFYYDVQLALLSCALFAIVVCVSCLAGLRQLPYQRRAYQCRGRIAGTVLQLITGLPRLRVAAAENRALVYWAREFRTLRELEFRVRRVSNVLAAFAQATPLISTVVLFAAIAFFPRESMPLGAFLAFLVAFSRLLSAGLSVSATVGSLVEIVPIYERSRPILEALPEVDLSKAVPTDLRGDIELNQVSFRYEADGPLVLDNISLRIRPGQFVAFVGPSGAGKSTLLRLLLGFEEPTTGGIYYDREDLAKLDLQSLRRQAGVVLQSARLLPGTVLDNIVGSSRCIEQDAWNAARLAGFDEDIRQMPQGIHTPLAEGGGALSGGQRQRLMIARAIASRPRLLFFDEATSAQDNETQARVSRALDELKATRVVIAHRLSTIRNADQIVVLDAGCLVEQGTFDELIQKRGLFARLAKRQMA